MARWRRAVELAMTGEDIETLTALSRSSTEPRAGCRVQRSRSPIASGRRSSRWAKDLVCIIRRCSAASSGRWPVAGWGARPPTTTGQGAGDHRAGQGLVGVSGLRQGRGARLSAPSCGRRGFWPVMRASTGRRRVTTVSPIGRRRGVQDSRPRGHQAAARRDYSLERPRRRLRAEDGRASGVYREVHVLKKPPPTRTSRPSRSRSSRYDDEARNPGHRDVQRQICRRRSASIRPLRES